MKKLTVLALTCVFALSACSAIPGLSTPAPNVDAAGTVNALVETANAQTQAVQPTPTAVPDTPTLVVAEASPTLPLITATLPPDLFGSNLTTTPGTATSVPTLPSTLTATLTPIGKTTLTASPTLGIRTYGTLPPQNRPYTDITITNKSKAEAYISLQIVTDQGYTIIEYPVKKFVKISIPTGEYTYVVWVGGRKFVGYFHASQFEAEAITIFRDKIIVK
jgi:hypothetical protein